MDTISSYVVGTGDKWASGTIPDALPSNQRMRAFIRDHNKLSRGIMAVGGQLKEALTEIALLNNQVKDDQAKIILLENRVKDDHVKADHKDELTKERADDHVQHSVSEPINRVHDVEAHLKDQVQHSVSLQVSSIHNIKDQDHEGVLYDKTHSYTPEPLETVFIKAGCKHLYDLYEKHYQNDPHFGGEVGDEKVLQAPPVKRLCNVYGVNMDTEKMYFYKTDQKGTLQLDTHASPKIDHHVVRDGIAYETKSTPQLILGKLKKITSNTQVMELSLMNL